MQIRYYLNFKEDKRISMDAYANSLIEYQKNNYKDVNVQSFRPKIDIFSYLLYFKKIKMRYARYISYPKQIKKLPTTDISHICDHQYAHLYSIINSKIKFVTVHDLVPFVFYKKIGKWPHLLSHSLSNLKYFDRVFAVSKNTKSDILKYTDCPEDKIKVILETVEDFFNNSAIDETEICKKYNLPINKKKILITGNIFYKNTKTSFLTLEKLIKKDQDIFFVKLGGVLEMDGFEHLTKYIKCLPFLKRREIPNIYKICKILFFPSMYEGFGRPLLEAMQCGTPIVCSNNSAIPEVVGDAALKSDCYDVDSFVKNIVNLLTDEKFYLLKRNEGLKRAKIFNLKNFHDKLINIYSTEINNFI